MIDHSASLASMVGLIADVAPLRRMINSAGLDAAFERVRETLPTLHIHEYAPGEAADDWSVPRAWELNAASLKDATGRTIVSDRDSHLFVAAYSEPVHGRFTKAEIASHVRCHPILGDAFFMEHRNAYNYALTDWGITLPRKVWDSLSDTEQYEVHIDVSWNEKRTMKVGEVFVKGTLDRTVCFTAHIDELCNDNLSSCAVLVEFFRELTARNWHPAYSYQLLLVPETIGTFFYVKNNREKLAGTVAMVNLETVGRGDSWVIKQSLHPKKYIDQLMQVAARDILGGYKTVDFFGGLGNEERVFEYPTIGIQSAALQRFPFDEYHSSADTPDKISGEHLLTALAFVRRLQDVIERDFVPKYTTFLPPWLTRHELYFDSKDQPELFAQFMNQVQFSIDGKSSLVELCDRYEIPFDAIDEYLRKFVKLDLIYAGATREVW